MGVAMRRELDQETGEEGELQGIRIPIFNYTGKEILTIKKYEKKVEEEIERVKNLTDGKTAGWIITSRPQDTIFHNDCVSVMKGIGMKTKEKLEIAGIRQVKDFISSDTSPDAVASKLTSIADSSGCSLTTIQKFHAQASNATPGSCPNDINYLNSDNPYQARYGERWEEEIKKVRFMSKYCDVRDLVRYIDSTARETFKNTKYASSYLFYHDALISMTDKDCLDWMEQEGILKRWIRPELGCNDEIVICDEDGNEKVNTRYSGRPVGNCMELMPLDNSLFRDTRTAADLHVTLTCMLPRHDPRRFSKATPKEITRMIERIWDPVEGVSPPSNRIIQDISRLKENIKLVVEADGAIVPGVCDRNGHRNQGGTGRRYHPRHADQSALSIEELPLHKDCREVVLELEATERERFEKSRGN